jgi:hypothetical protein
MEVTEGGSDQRMKKRKKTCQISPRLDHKEQEENTIIHFQLLPCPLAHLAFLTVLTQLQLWPCVVGTAGSYST